MGPEGPKNTNNHYWSRIVSTEERLARNEQSISDIRGDIKEMKGDLHEMRKEVKSHMDGEEQDREIIMSRLGALEAAREKDRAFLGGVVWTVGAVVTAITLLLKYAGEYIKNALT